MNSHFQNASARNAAASAAPQDVSVDETLRLIASLPAPQGLEERVLAGLRAAPRRARVLRWPALSRPSSGWMRAAAAAAIVAVVAGGGWGIHSLVQPIQPSVRSAVLPPRPAAAAGFSSAGAMRTPQTLHGPVLVQQVTAPPSQAKPAKKIPARTAAGKARSPQAARKAPPAATSQEKAPTAAPPAEGPVK
jgi:hypothetical protein